MISRRNVLRLTGGGFVLAAGSAGAFLGTRDPAKAREPWHQAGSYTEPRRRALSYAILAPNPHNRQPWEVDLGTDDTIVIWRDRQRNLPATDPFDRQLTIGMGCFLELLTIAAAESGHALDTTLFPEGDNGPVAVVEFKTGGEPDPLFGHVMSRRSCKEPFEDRPVPVDLATKLSKYGDVHTEPSRVASIKALTWDAWLIETRTPHTMKESVDLFRMGKAEIEANPDGIDLGGPILETLMRLGMLTREGQMDPDSPEFAQSMEMFEEILHATPAYVSLVTNGNTRLDQIAAGRRWLRLNLATTAMGLALHPVSQALQEYPEMARYYKTAHDLLAEPGDTVQMLGRLGYGPMTKPAPRWPMETRIKHA